MISEESGDDDEKAYNTAADTNGRNSSQQTEDEEASVDSEMKTSKRKKKHPMVITSNAEESELKIIGDDLGILTPIGVDIPSRTMPHTAKHATEGRTFKREGSTRNGKVNVT